MPPNDEHYDFAIAANEHGWTRTKIHKIEINTSQWNVFGVLNICVFASPAARLVFS